MLIVLANWLFILVLSGVWGFALYRLLRRWTDVEAPEASLTAVVLLGLASLTTLGNLISLWWPVGKTICLVFCAGVPLLAYLNRQSWPDFMKKQWILFRSNARISTLYFLLLVAIALIKTIGVSEIEDEAAYHLPLIRWIENYPVVPGIANIENRLGLNPSIYLTNALFGGVAWLYKGGLYDLNSFLFVLIGGSFLSGLRPLLRGQKDHLLSRLVQVAALIFLFRVYLTGVDADFLNLYGTLYLLVFILRQLEQSRFGHPDWQAVWSVLFFCFLVTNKFSAALMAPIDRYRNGIFFRPLGWFGFFTKKESTATSVQEGFDLKNHWLYPAPVAYAATYSTQYFNGIKIRVAPDDFCRDAVPPCFPKHYHPGLQARGKTVEEGFRVGY